jgi:hypothetical protein
LRSLSGTSGPAMHPGTACPAAQTPSKTREFIFLCIPCLLCLPRSLSRSTDFQLKYMFGNAIITYIDWASVMIYLFGCQISWWLLVVSFNYRIGGWCDGNGDDFVVQTACLQAQELPTHTDMIYVYTNLRDNIPASIFFSYSKPKVASASWSPLLFLQEVIFVDIKTLIHSRP